MSGWRWPEPTDLPTWLSKTAGDYFMVEEERYPEWHPYDPNRIAGLPLGGYGWPEHEDMVLVPILAGAKPKHSGGPKGKHPC